MFTYPGNPQCTLPRLNFPSPVTTTFEDFSTIHYTISSLHELQQIYLLKDTLIMYGKLDSKGKMPVMVEEQLPLSSDSLTFFH